MVQKNKNRKQPFSYLHKTNMVMTWIMLIWLLRWDIAAFILCLPKKVGYDFIFVAFAFSWEDRGTWSSSLFPPSPSVLSGDCDDDGFDCSFSSIVTILIPKSSSNYLLVSKLTKSLDMMIHVCGQQWKRLLLIFKRREKRVGDGWEGGPSLANMIKSSQEWTKLYIKTIWSKVTN